MKRSEALQIIIRTYYNYGLGNNDVLADWTADAILTNLEQAGMKPYRIIDSETEVTWLNHSDVIVHKTASLTWEPENDSKND